MFTTWRTCFFLLLLPLALWLLWVGSALGSQVGLMLLGPSQHWCCCPGWIPDGSAMEREVLEGMSEMSVLG